MQGAGSALMGIGFARGEDRAVQAAEMAISSPLLEASIDGAHGVLLSIQGGSDLGLFEINEAARLVQEAAHAEANIIFGAVIDDALGDEVRVTVIAAGFDGGTPAVRRDARALGQVGAGSSATGVPPTPRTPQTHAPTPTPAPVEPEPQRVGAHPAIPEVPAFLSAEMDPVPLTGSLEVPKLFTEPVPRVEHDELDVPDFLK
jgi:cell division protein FtsZ